MPISHLPRLLLCVFVCLFPHTQDEEAIPVELRNLPEYKELLELKRLKKQTLQEIREDKVGVQHAGFKVKTPRRHYGQAFAYMSVLEVE